MLPWLLAWCVLGAPPPEPARAVSLAASCTTRADLGRELERLGVTLVEESALQVSVASAPGGVEVVLRRAGVPVLRRLLKGTCDEAAAATALVVQRYLHGLGAVDPGATDGGAGRADSSARAESATSRGGDGGQPGSSRPATRVAPVDGPSRTGAAPTGDAVSGLAVTPGRVAGARVERRVSAPPSGAPGPDSGSRLEQGRGALGAQASRGGAGSDGRTGSEDPQPAPPPRDSADEGAPPTAAPRPDAPSRSEQPRSTPLGAQQVGSDAGPGASTAVQPQPVLDPRRSEQGRSTPPVSVEGTRGEEPLPSSGLRPETSGPSERQGTSPSAQSEVSTGGAEPNAGQPRGTALADATTPARDSAQPPPAAAPPTWSLHVGGGILTPAPGASPTPVLSLEPQVFLGAWRLSLLGAFSFGGSVAVVDQSVTRGTLTARDVLAVPSLGLCTTARVELCGTVLAGLRLVLGESSGSLLFQSQFRVLGAFVTGAGVELTLNLGPVRLTLAAALLVNPVPASLTLTGLPTTLTTPVLEGVVRGTVGFGTPRWHKE